MCGANQLSWRSDGKKRGEKVIRNNEVRRLVPTVVQRFSGLHEHRIDGVGKRCGSRLTSIDPNK